MEHPASQHLVIDYGTHKNTLRRRLITWMTCHPRLVTTMGLVMLALAIGGPFALVEYGKYQWTKGLGTNPIQLTDSQTVVFDGFIFGNEPLQPGWGVRYRVVDGTGSGVQGFPVYLLVYPSLKTDAFLFRC